MTDATLLTGVRHNCWADLQLLEFCAKLTPEQLEWTAPGTYGSIHRTLQHTIGAEHGYLHALTGGEAPPMGMLPTDRLVPIAELIERAKSNAERIERTLAAGDFDPDRRITRPSGTIATVRVIATQFIHHGSDHRAHVGTILGAHGVEPPNLDVWAYGVTTGEVVWPQR